jgi:hypothetical protein
VACRPVLRRVGNVLGACRHVLGAGGEVPQRQPSVRGAVLPCPEGRRARLRAGYRVLAQRRAVLEGVAAVSIQAAPASRAVELMHERVRAILRAAVRIPIRARAILRALELVHERVRAVLRDTRAVHEIPLQEAGTPVFRPAARVWTSA